MLAIRTANELEREPAPVVVVPAITATAAPAFVPPMDPVIPPNPVIAPPPPYQHRGEGGTPFGARPTLYIQPMRYGDEYDARLYPLEPRVGAGDGAVPRPRILPMRPGEKEVMPVPTGQQPTKPPVPPVTPSVQPPGPITGTVAGFDLARVPLWAWLVAAALLGSRLLR